MVVTSQVCSAVDALANLQQQIIEAINGKYAALRRLSELLEAVSDLTAFIPDISKLIPISAIDISTYETLRSECPFLNLPPSSQDPEQALGELRARVNTAYGLMLRKLNAHPLSRMGKLQGKLNDYQAQYNLNTLGRVDFMQCLQAACQAAAVVEGAVSSLSNVTTAQIQASAQTYVKNMVTDQGKVLSEAAQSKVDNLDSIKTSLKELMDIPPDDLPAV